MLNQIKLEALRQEILKGIEQADQGLFSTLSIEEIKAEGRRRLLEQQQSTQ